MHEGAPTEEDGVQRHIREDFEDLVDFTVAGEERAAVDELGKDAAYAPHVDWRRVPASRAGIGFGPVSRRP